MPPPHLVYRHLAEKLRSLGVQVLGAGAWGADATVH